MEKHRNYGTMALKMGTMALKMGTVALKMGTWISPAPLPAFPWDPWEPWGGSPGGIPCGYFPIFFPNFPTGKSIKITFLTHFGTLGMVRMDSPWNFIMIAPILRIFRWKKWKFDFFQIFSQILRPENRSKTCFFHGFGPWDPQNRIQHKKIFIFTSEFYFFDDFFHFPIF